MTAGGTAAEGFAQPAYPHVCHSHARFRPDCRNCKARLVSFCAHLDAEGLERLGALTTSRLYAKGTVIFEQGMVLDHVMVIIEGLVRLYQLLPDGRRQVTGFLGTGDLMGGLKRSDGAHCTAQAITDVIACTVGRKAFLGLLETYPQLAFGLLFTATDEIEAQQDHIVLLGRKTLEERLAAFLLLYSERWQTHEHNGTAIHLPMTRADIADYLGLTVESISRTFTRFRKEGLIEMPSSSEILVRNLPALYAKAGFDEVPRRGAMLGL